MSDGDDPDDRGPPAAATLAGLDTDAWAALLPHVRAALAAVPADAVTPRIARLRDASTGQLAGGPRRKDLCGLLAEGGEPWAHLRARLAVAEGLPEAVAALVPGAPASIGTTAEQEEDEARDALGATTSDERTRLRERLRSAREERDTWRRRAEGERARAAALEERLAEVEAARDALDASFQQAQRELSAAADDRARAVERETRRREGELRSLRDEIAALRRAEEARKERSRREEASERDREQRAAAAARREQEAARSVAPARIVPGRPTALPRGVMAGTTQAADLLLDRGRLVVVDGYNVTLRHRGHLDLQTQRTWLIQLLATMAARRGIRPVVVFDGERAGGGRPPSGLREVEVRFTAAGVTADDEVVLAVEGTDEPVVVVTDDRDLVTRVTVGGADVITTGQLLGVAT